MTVLAVDTALAACQAVLARGGEVLASRSEPMERGHQERLAPLVAELFVQSGLFPTDVDRVAVTAGPGSFTGLRVGVAFAKGLAIGLGRPLVGLGTLHALADEAAGVAAAVIAAPHGRVYLQVFRDGSPRGEPALQGIDAALALCRGEGVRRVIGPGAEAFAAGLPDAGVDARPWPDLRRLARLAEEAPLASGPLIPLYLRGADARTIAERAALKAAQP